MAIGGYRRYKKIDLEWWVHQIKAGEEYRKKYALEDKWDTWRDAYRGQWSQDIQPTNLFFKMLRTVVPRVYFRNPSVSVSPGKAGAENAIFAMILERADNKLIRDMQMKEQMKRVIRNAFMFGTGFGKLGYGAQYTPTPDPANTAAPLDEGRYQVEYNSLVQENMPWFMSIHPGHIVVPDGLYSFESTPWICHHIIRPIEEVKNDPRLENTKSLRATRMSSIGDSNRQNPAAGVYRPVEMIDLYEIRDRRTGMVFVIAPSQEDSEALLIKPDEFQNTGLLPFYSLIFNDDDEVFWGTPDSQILDPIQNDLNDTRTQIMKHRRMSIVKLLYQQGKISDTEVAKMVSEDVLPAIAVNGPLGDAVEPLQAASIPQDLLVAADLGMQDARETVGFSRNQFGEYHAGSSDKTATEAQIVNQAAEIRVEERRDMAADMLVEVVRGMHQIIFNHWDTEQVIEVSGPSGVPFWIQFTGSMLANGRYEVKIDPDTSVPETKEVRQAKAFKAYQMFFQDPMVDPIKLRHYVFRNMNDPAFDDMLKQQFPQAIGNAGAPIPADQLIGAMQQQQQGDSQQRPGSDGADSIQSIVAQLNAGG